jgi:small nuclear ribonucleoprotein (snRNP)-like protein
MFPLAVLRAGKGSKIMVDTKNGSSFHGILEECDNYMNLKLLDSVVTSFDGSFSKSEVSFVRGNYIKSIQMPEGSMDKLQEDLKKKQAEQMAMRGQHRDQRESKR